MGLEERGLYSFMCIVLLFLYYLKIFLQVCTTFVIKFFKKNPAIVWRVVWRGANLVQARGNGAQSRAMALRWGGGAWIWEIFGGAGGAESTGFGDQLLAFRGRKGAMEDDFENFGLGGWGRYVVFIHLSIQHLSSPLSLSSSMSYADTKVRSSLWLHGT